MMCHKYTLTTLISILIIGIVFISITESLLYAQTSISPFVLDSAQSTIRKQSSESPIGVRKIYAPENQIQKWPFGIENYIYISADKFEQQYHNWRSRFDIESEISTNHFTFTGLYISSARYIGKLNSSGELSGIGEWTVRYNRQFSSNSKNDKTWVEQLLLLPKMKSVMEELTFVPSTNKDSSTENNQIPFETTPFLFGTLPSGQQVFYSPDDGELKFRWSVTKTPSGKYVLQAPPGLFSQWEITIPENKSIKVTNTQTNQPIIGIVTESTSQPSSVDTEKHDKTYTIHLSNAQCVNMEVVDIQQNLNNQKLFYQQDTVYTFHPHQLSTECTFTFTTKDNTSLPSEIPFKVNHNPNLLWTAELDGNPIEIHIVDSGYCLLLKETQNNTQSNNTSSTTKEATSGISHVLTLKSSCTIEELTNINKLQNESGTQNNSNMELTAKYPLPRVELCIGVWLSGTALCNTIQKPLGVFSNFGEVSDYQINSKSRYITSVNLFKKEADVVMTLSPFRESLYSQNDTIVHWDGLQLSFNDSIYLWSEQGNRYVLTASLPDRLTIDNVQISPTSITEENVIIDNWEIQNDKQDPHKQTLVIYLHESVRPGHSITIDIASHIITLLSRPLPVKMLQPILFDGFTAHRQSVQVNVGYNQKFSIGDRVLFSSNNNPVVNDIDSQTIVLPDGIIQIPQPDTEIKTGTTQGNTAFIINVKKWGDSVVTLVPEYNSINAQANVTLNVNEHDVFEFIELNVSGGSTKIKTFEFDYQKSENDTNDTKSTKSNIENTSDWNCILVSTDNEFRVPVTPKANNCFVIEFPINVATPFILKLSRKVPFNGTYESHLFRIPECHTLSILTTILSNPSSHLEIDTQNVEHVTTRDKIFDDSLLGQYLYTQENLNNNTTNVTNSSPVITIKRTSKSKNDTNINSTIWAWTQYVNEYHFASGSVLACVEWDIENRFPPECHTVYSQKDKYTIYWTIPGLTVGDSQKPNGFITGLWIDNVLIPSTDIHQDKDGVFSIIAPANKKRFTMSVQWTSYNNTLSSVNNFRVQAPRIQVPVFQTKWNVYYPTSYRQLFSFNSSDPTVDGFFPRLFGPLIRNESNTLNFVNQFWNKNTNLTTPRLDNPSSNTKTDVKSRNVTQNSNIASLNSLSSPNSWNCYSFSDNSTQVLIYVIRNEVSESIRWCMFIVSLCFFFSLRHKLKVSEQSPSDSQVYVNPNKIFLSMNSENSIERQSKIENVSPSVYKSITMSHNRTPINTNNSQLEHQSSEIQTLTSTRSKRDSRKIRNWGFRRWLLVIGLVSGILAEVLPWILSIPFSALFMSSFIGLLVFGFRAKQPSKAQTNYPHSTIVKSESMTSFQTWLGMIIIFVVINVFLQSISNGQQFYSNPSNTHRRVTSNLLYQNKFAQLDNTIPVQTDTSNLNFQHSTIYNNRPNSSEYQIFIPTNKNNQSPRYYYVPQNLIDIIHQSNLQANDRCWVIYRTTYIGQIFRQISHTETSTWKCSMEIETFQPNTLIELPDHMTNSVYTISDISIRKGASQKMDSTAEAELKENQNVIWSWGSPISAVPQWEEEHQSWSFKIVQPGRYLIETQYQPQITTKDGKNEIAFPIVTSINSTLELTVPNTISGLEFPDSIGNPIDIISEDNNNVFSSETKFITKRVTLGTTDQLKCRWNVNESSTTGPSYNVDTLSWWQIYPDHSLLRMRYNVHVDSGTVSSIRITGDSRLTLVTNNPEQTSHPSEDTKTLSELTDNSTLSNSENTHSRPSTAEIEQQEKKNNDTKSNKPLLHSPSEKPSLIVPLPNAKLVTPPVRPQELRSNILSRSPIESVIPDETQNTYIVTFKTPIRSQITFDLEFLWEHSAFGAPQYTCGIFPDKHAGRRLLAFTIDPKLQIDWSSNTLDWTSISPQNFYTQWTNRNGKNTNKPAVDSSRSDTQTLSQTILPSPPEYESKTFNTIPDIAYDINQSKRKNDTSEESKYICLNIQPIKGSQQAQANAFILTYEDHLFCQHKWEITSLKGERSGYSIELPDSMISPQNTINIISATIHTDKRSYNANVHLQNRNLELYWGTPISGKHVIELSYELKNTKIEQNKEIQFLFRFPDLKGVDVTKYKFTLSRTDNVTTNIHFDPKSTNQTVFKAIETPIESPISDRHQQGIGTWETSVDNSSPKPVPFLISVDKNSIQATIDYTATLLLENQPTLIINGTVNIEKGILDEIAFQIPDNYGFPISSKASIICQLDTDSITPNNYYLRPQTPFTTGSEFQLSIPLESSSNIWKIIPIDFINVTVTKATAVLPQKQNEESIHWERIARQSIKFVESKNDNLYDLKNYQFIGMIPQTTQKWIHVFDLKYWILLVSESHYYTSVEFTIIQAGQEHISVTLPENCSIIDVQISNRSVQWSYTNKNMILIPITSEKELVDVRIVYSCEVFKALYSEPITIIPIHIEGTDAVSSAFWTIMPWKKYNKISTNRVQQKNYLQKQNQLLNDLLAQMTFIQSNSIPVTEATVTRFQMLYSNIDSQIKQFIAQSKNVTDNSRFRVCLKEWETLKNKYDEMIVELKGKFSIENMNSLSSQYNMTLATGEKGFHSISNYDNSDNLIPIYAYCEYNCTIILELNIRSGVKPWKPIWWILALIFIPIFIWLSFFPPVAFIPWRPSFILGTLGVFWLLELNLYGVALLLITMAFFNVLKNLRRLSSPNIVPLKVR